MKHLTLILACIAFLLSPISSTQVLAQTHPSYPLMSGLGSQHHPVSTTNQSAQRFFDQGLALVYAFNHDEAVRSFQQAAKLDPQLAMAYWGMALALGPNINFDIDFDREKLAYEAAQKALLLSNSTQITQQERDYIKTLSKRYSPDRQADLRELAIDYKNAMADLVKRYPNDLDAATLYAESLMDLHPWQLWSSDGKPESGTAEIVNVLESVLKRNPNHLGANHYYIHAVEASPHPERALASAKRLETLAPAAGHLVHMPAHIYFLVGDYAGAMHSNQAAIAADRAYIQTYQAQGIYPAFYLSHNLHFLAVASSMAGNYAQAMAASEQLFQHASPFFKDVPMAEGLGATSFLIQVQFRDWEHILAAPAPDRELPTTNALWHFARGMANARTDQIAEAMQEREAFLTARQVVPADATIIINSAHTVLDIAGNMLDAEIARAKQDYPAAIAFLQQAVADEDTLSYDEPPGWYVSSREFLGGVFLASGDATEAEKVFRADLEKYPRNGRSLLGLQASLEAQGKNKDAQFVHNKFAKAWQNADTQLQIVDL